MTFVISQTSTSTFKKEQIERVAYTPTMTFEFPKNFSCYIKFKKVKGKISFYCHVNSDKPTNVELTCKINGKLYYNENNLYEAGEDNWGEGGVGTMDELCPNGVMNVEWTVTLKSESNPFLQSVGSSLLFDDRFSDFIICCDDKEFKVHKAVLASASPVFAAMFQTNCKEGIEGRVAITDFVPDVVDAGIKFIYERTIPTELDASVVVGLWYFADKYSVFWNDMIYNWMVKNITNKNVCSFASFAKERDLSLLYNDCINYFVTNFQNICSFDGFDDLTDEILKEILRKKCPVPNK